MTWHFPLIDWKGNVPGGNHPGAFGVVRKHDVHTGVDLYVPNEDLVLAVETGFCIAIENYTGPEVGSPWWLPTKALLIEGSSGVVCYGEISSMGIGLGDHVLRGMVIGHVLPVLPEGRTKENIPGHSRYMLHLELYELGTRESVWWKLDEEKPKNLLDPTHKLLESLSHA